MFLARAVPLLFLFASGVWAQSEMAQCRPGYAWNHNSLDQDPCTIGSTLDASCRGLPSYIYPPLNTTEWYLPPNADNLGDLSCDCNTVMYNLYMACVSCQRAQIYSWTIWAEACQNVSISEYPVFIPQGTAIPRWAFFNVTSTVNQTYDQATMISIGRDPEEPPTPPSPPASSSLGVGPTG